MSTFNNDQASVTSASTFEFDAELYITDVISNPMESIRLAEEGDDDLVHGLAVKYAHLRNDISTFDAFEIIASTYFDGGISRIEQLIKDASNSTNKTEVETEVEIEEITEIETIETVVEIEEITEVETEVETEKELEIVDVIDYDELVATFKSPEDVLAVVNAAKEHFAAGHTTNLSEAYIEVFAHYKNGQFDFGTPNQTEVETPLSNTRSVSQEGPASNTTAPVIVFVCFLDYLVSHLFKLVKADTTLLVGETRRLAEIESEKNFAKQVELSNQFKKLMTSKLAEAPTPTLFVQIDDNLDNEYRGYRHLESFFRYYLTKADIYGYSLNFNNSAKSRSFHIGSLELPGIAEDADINSGVKVTSVSDFFMVYFLQSISNFKVSTYKKFLKAVAKTHDEVSFDGSIVTIEGNKFDFLDGKITTETNRVLEVNDVIEVAHYRCKDSRSILFVLALSCLGKSKAAVNTLIGQAVNLFKREENYGERTDKKRHLSYWANQNSILPVSFTYNTDYGTPSFPFGSFATVQLDKYKVGTLLQSGVLAIADKYNMKSLITGVGAESLYVGWADESKKSIVTINDAAKSTKIPNRFTLNKYKFAKLNNTVTSKLAVSLSNGELAYNSAALTPTIISNSKWGHGSGVAEVSSLFGLDFGFTKTFTGTYNVYATDIDEESDEESLVSTKAALLRAVGEKCIGRTYQPGETIIAFDDVTIVKNDTKNIETKVVAVKVLESSEYEIKISVITEVLGKNERWLKLRNNAKKLTTLPYEVEGFDEEWHVHLNIETMKGHLPLVEMFAQSREGQTLYNPHGATLTLDDGTTVDLKEVSNNVTEWVTENSKETIISKKLARSSYNHMKPLFDKYSANSLEELRESLNSPAEVTVDTFVEDNGDEDFVILHERVEYIFGNLLFDVEVSTPKEATSTTNLTLESAAGIFLQDEVVGTKLLKTATKKLNAAESLINAFIEDKDSIANTYVVNTENYEEIAEFLAKLDEVDLFNSDQRSMISKVKNVFPTGFTIKTSDIEVNIFPEVVLAFGQFQNGFATRETGAVVALIRQLSIYFKSFGPNEEGEIVTDNKNTFKLARVTRQAQYTLSIWYQKLTSSKSIMKKFTRSGKVATGKVRTSFSPLVNDSVVTDKDGNKVVLPTVVLNPNCFMAKYTKAKEGNILGISRVPMPFVGACVVKFSEEVEVGHALVCPFIWHAIADSDSDGKPNCHSAQ